MHNDNKKQYMKTAQQYQEKSIGRIQEGKFILGGRNKTGFMEKGTFKLDFEAERISTGRSEKE